MSNKAIRYNARKLREMHEASLTSPIHAAQITGNRVPTQIDLNGFFSLFAGVPKDAGEIAVRINCPPGNVLRVLLEMEREGLVRPDSADGERTERTKWVR